MKKTILYFFCITLIACALSSCADKKRDLELVYGTYRIVGTDSRIILRNDNTLTVVDYDMSDLEKEAYEDFIIIQKNWGREENERLSAAEEEKIRADIDLNRQFLNQSSSFSQEIEDGVIGIYVPVENCDLFFYIQFYPSDQSIVFDNKVFNLEK